MDFPSPDDLCTLIETEQKEAELAQKTKENQEVEKYLLQLSALLNNPKTRPKPENDGWVYIPFPLPYHVTEDSTIATDIQCFLAKANWDAEISHGIPNKVAYRKTKSELDQLNKLGWRNAPPYHFYAYVRIRRKH